ncbi:S1 family peptidase [Nocardia sp. NBC_01503]|uniref:hypothetical protein n=1 Tax=Nocardia sp. NBC_01503 TaxID=2975997 RepID=UPI002E7B8EF8|nr:hypothetical protein [Nocardia sp. NBC_01503]WTL33493.1 S1 family peptidase [Nocardia sp. NBC_01503]
MLGFRRWAVPAVVVATLGMSAAQAQADPGDTRAALGGGSGIVLGRATKCSLTTIGHDAAGRLVGFTAGHCAEAGTPVRGELFPDAGVLGVVRTSDAELDYAVIEFDPAMVSPLRTVGATTITGIGELPATWDVACQNGRTSGFACGTVWSAGPGGFIDQACSSYGDSGGPLTIGDQLVGLVSGPLINDTVGLRFSCTNPGNPLHSPVIAVSFDSVRAAVDAGKGIGSGFQPI